MTDTRISLVIATYNWPEALRACVEACFRQTDDNYEIIIADDGSGEPTRALVAELCARSPVPMRHVWQPDDGFRLAMARNRGILAAKHALGLADKLRHRRQGGLNKAAPLLFKLPDIGRRRRFSFRRIKGCNMAFWRSDLERVNGFDESFRGWGHEDADIVVRLHHAGVVRKDGAYATEVFHLWHREAQRDQATSNKQLVLDRFANKTTQAVIGLEQHANEAHALATKPVGHRPGL